VLAVGYLAEVLVAVSYLLSADVTNQRAAGARHFIASRLLHKLFATALLRTGTNSGFGNGFLDFESSAGLVLPFNFLALERDVRLFAAFATRLEPTVTDWTAKNHFSGRQFCLIATFGTSTRKLS